jgi:phospholipid/cholesterol/gamma-HCH transport system ATP-binding protein
MVEVRDLHMEFEGHLILDGISLQANPGEILAIMGTSGGGKTTLLRCISGLLRPTKGSIEVDGVDVNLDPEEARRRMGMVFQSAALFDFMNVIDNVLFGIDRQLRLGPQERISLAGKALDRVGLDSRDLTKMPGELSGGMRKRVGIARALALSPAVMLYDEPTTGLDPITTFTIDALISSLRSEHQLTSLVVSHDVNSVARVADRVAFLHDGSLVFTGTAKEFEESPLPAIRELIDKARATRIS